MGAGRLSIALDTGNRCIAGSLGMDIVDFKKSGILIDLIRSGESHADTQYKDQLRRCSHHECGLPQFAALSTVLCKEGAPHPRMAS